MMKARHNFSNIGHTEHLKFVTGDARDLLPEIEGPIDMLYLEAKVEGEPDIYLPILKTVYDRLPEGAWVIAHDIYDKDAIDDMQPYLNWVRDPAHFSTSTAIDIDFCGLELSVK